MIVGVVIDFAVGSLCLVLGLLLWKKQRVSILHDYHYQHVKKEDIPAYTRNMGIGLMIVGLGIITTGILDLANSPFWWIPLLAGILSGFIVLFRAQKKYNGSVLG